MNCKEFKCNEVEMFLEDKEFIDEMNKLSGKFCKCGKEMTVGEESEFGCCLSCFDFKALYDEAERTYNDN